MRGGVLPKAPVVPQSALRADAEGAEADGARVRDHAEPLVAQLAECRVALVRRRAARPVPGVGEEAFAVRARPAEGVDRDLHGAPPRRPARRAVAEALVLCEVRAIEGGRQRLATDEPPARRARLLGGERLLVDRPLGTER